MNTVDGMKELLQKHRCIAIYDPVQKEFRSLKPGPDGFVEDVHSAPTLEGLVTGTLDKLGVK